jgi:hypothetical protein
MLDRAGVSKTPAFVFGAGVRAYTFLEGFDRYEVLIYEGERSHSQKHLNKMKTIAKFGLAALTVEAFFGMALSSNANMPDPSNPFTKHGLPIPGAYFQTRGNQQVATIVVSKSGPGVGEGKQPESKVENKRTSAHSSISEFARILHGPRR